MTWAGAAAEKGDLAAAPGLAGDVRWRATAFAVTVLCLLLAAKVSDVVLAGAAGQVPVTVALFVLPLAYAVPGARRWLARYRWPVLAVQATLTWCRSPSSTGAG